MLNVKHVIKIGVLLFLFLIGLTSLSAEISPQPSRVDSVLSPDQVKIVYTVQGTGKTALIFIHGGFADRSFWVHQLQPFAQKYQVIAIDLAGHGESGTNRTHWGIHTFAEDVRAVMEKEKVDRAVLIGNSMGGPIILQTTRLVPQKVVALIAVDTFHFLKLLLPPPEYLKNLAQSIRADFSKEIKRMAKSLFHADINPTLYAEIEQKMLSCPGKGEMGGSLYDSFVAMPETFSLNGITQPIRCINGDIYPVDMEGNRSVYADFDAVIIPHTGHYPMYEKPELFNEQLSALLEKLVKE